MTNTCTQDHKRTQQRKPHYRDSFEINQRFNIFRAKEDYKVLDGVTAWEIKRKIYNEGSRIGNKEQPFWINCRQNVLK